jgi:hypothetical protein
MSCARPRRRTSAGVFVAVVAALSGGAGAADSDSLVGIHFWGDRNDAAPATMLDSIHRGGWDVEIVNTGNPEWNDVDVVGPLYQNFNTTYNVTPVTRLGYYWGKTLPAPGSPEYTNWPAYIANNVLSPLKNTAHIWQMGNEPNLMGEATNWINQQIMPAQYAALYQSVQNAIQSPSLVGTAGAHELLVAPVSPGAATGDRWMAGTTWLDQTLAAIPAAQVDGVALHAYGGGTTARDAILGFRNSLLDQIAVVDTRGLAGVPLYITEWNRNTPIGSGQEAVTAQFARDALKFLDRWNRTPGNHNIVSSGWFVYDGSSNGTGGWDSYSIEYYKSQGAAGSGDLYTAFYDSARAGYKAGVSGTRPLPSTVSFVDDFETGTGQFASATPLPGSAGGSGTTVGTTTASFKVRQKDSDSYTKFYADKIGIVDDPAVNNWTVRYLSGGGSPSGKATIPLTSGTDGYVGFYLRVYTVNGSENLSPAAGNMSAQIVLDTDVGGGSLSDAGVARTIIADGEWHLYEWNLDAGSDWTPFAGSDGLLGAGGNINTGSITIDSILLQGGNFNVEMLLDSVMRNSAGSLSVMSVPEPTAVGTTLSLLAAAALARRRRRTSSLSRCPVELSRG